METNHRYGSGVGVASMTGSLEFNIASADQPSEQMLRCGEMFQVNDYIPSLSGMASVTSSRMNYDTNTGFRSCEINFVMMGDVKLDREELEKAIQYDYPNHKLKPDPAQVKSTHGKPSGELYLTRKIELE